MVTRGHVQTGRGSEDTSTKHCGGWEGRGGSRGAAGEGDWTVVTTTPTHSTRQRGGGFTLSGGKSDRQRAERGLSKPQRSVGGCRNETKKTTATASHMKESLALSKKKTN